MKNFFKSKWFKSILFVLIIVAVVVLLTQKKEPTVSYRTFDVKRGDIASTITGTGTLTASETRNEVAKVSSTVEDIYYVEGDRVEKGYVLVKLDSSDYEVNVESQRNAIKQAELSKTNLDRQVNALKITAPTNGYVENLSITEGSYVMTNNPVCNIINSRKDEITLQFVSSSADKIQVGCLAKVLLTGSLNYVDGVVSFVGDRITTLTTGATVIDVTIEVTDSQYSLSGVSANAEVTTAYGTFKSVNQSTFKTTSAGSVKAETSGTVKRLYVKNGQFVNAGDIIVELENNDLIVSAQTTALNLQNLYNQLSFAEDKLEDYKIVAPIDGIITMQNVKVGDNVVAGTVISTVSDKNNMEFKIPIDELDIARLDYDKEVRVTIDALSYTEDNPIRGKISKMPLEGTTLGGVTDYYVTITIPGTEDIRISMNADAEIIVEQKENVLYVPVESIEKENGESFVGVVKDNVKEKRKVTTGMKNVSYIEIIDGLEEGEQVIVPEQGSGLGFLLSM